MPENEETEQVETEPQEPATAPEAEGSEEEPFDRKRAEAALRKKNSEAENLRRRLKELEPLAKKAKELEDAQKSEQERLAEKLTSAEQRIQAFQQRAVRSEVKALASAEFADPEDAHAFLDLTSYVDDGGDIDTAAIQQDLKDLLKRKPHLAKPADTSPRVPKTDRTQGSSGNGNRTPNDPGEEFAGFMNRALTRGR
jgi:membrane protein involved in colicin uptake